MLCIQEHIEHLHKAQPQDRENEAERAQLAQTLLECVDKHDDSLVETEQFYESQSGQCHANAQEIAEQLVTLSGILQINEFHVFQRGVESDHFVEGVCGIHAVQVHGECGPGDGDYGQINVVVELAEVGEEARLGHETDLVRHKYAYEDQEHQIENDSKGEHATVIDIEEVYGAEGGRANYVASGQCLEQDLTMLKQIHIRIEQWELDEYRSCLRIDPILGF